MPVGVTAGIGMALLTAGWTCATAFSRLETAVEKNREAVARIADKLDEAAGDRWTRTDMLVWVHILRAQNPDLKIPEPRK